MSRNIIRFDNSKPAKSGSGRNGHVRVPEAEIQVTCARQSVSILIVADDADYSADLCRTLGEMAAFDVTIARVKTEAEARAATEFDHYDILILDERLASESVFSLARALARATPSCAPFLLFGDSPRPVDVSIPVPNSLVRLLQVLQVRDISAGSLEAAIVEGLEAARRRDGLMVQLEALGAAAPDGLDQILPWLRAMLGEMNRIHGGAALAANRISHSEDEDPLRLLQGAVSAADRMRGEMLDMVNRLEESRRQNASNPETVELTGLLAQTVWECRADAEARGQTLSYDRPDLPLVLSANGSLVRDLVRVILRNTICNTGRDARIDVGLSIRPGAVCISLRDSSPDGHWTRISGADIADFPDAEPLLRERAGSFVLIDEMMRACGGAIDIVSAPGVGNEMLCSLPLGSAD